MRVYFYHVKQCSAASIDSFCTVPNSAAGGYLCTFKRFHINKKGSPLFYRIWRILMRLMRRTLMVRKKDTMSCKSWQRKEEFYPSPSLPVSITIFISLSCEH